jgi:AcrR family transcriptional regulator
MRTTKELVYQTASEIADREGLSGVTLKAVAAALQIRTPSLYNHIESLDDLLREVAHRGMCEMNRRMTQAVIGVWGDAAIEAAAAAYLRFMIAHPGVYETIQWASWHTNDRTRQILSDYNALLEKLVRSCELDIPDVTPVVRLLTGFLHGYTTQQLGRALTSPEAVIEDMGTALDTILLGIHQKYQ